MSDGERFRVGVSVRIGLKGRVVLGCVSDNDLGAGCVVVSP
jgi:hypothetical protein